MPEPPTVRAVVVTWNGAHMLGECLDSLLAQTVAPEMEILVVDNASSDGTSQLLAEHYPSVRVLRMPENLGFAGGVAAGCEGFDGQWLALLNNDATFAPDAVEKLRTALQNGRTARVAAATARILLADPDERAPRLVNSTGNIVSRSGTGTDRDWLRAVGEESTDVDVFGFNGGAALLRSDALRQVGGFDARLFLYYEDTDLSWRLRAAGWSVRYVPEATAVHRHAASTGTDSPVFRYYNTRNSLVVFTRHAPFAVVARSVARQGLGWLRSGIRRGWRAEPTSARRRALLDWARGLSGTIRERRTIWADATVSRRTVARSYLRR